MPKGKYKKWLEPEGLVLIQGWTRDGLSDEQVARNMGVSRTSYWDWKKKYPDILNASKKGKEVVDYAVENALLREATSGNVTAMIFWLKNRRPDKWRDKPDYDASEKDIKTARDILVSVRRAAKDGYEDRA